jgi:hypothetical protein
MPEGLLLDECDIAGTDIQDGNAAGVYLRRGRRYWIRKCRIRTRSAGAAVYYKHALPETETADPADCVIEDCFFYGQARRGAWYGEWQWATFRNCIFERGSGVSVGGDDGGSPGGPPLRNDCTYDHCTFRGPVVLNPSDDQVPGDANGNTFANCLFEAPMTWWGAPRVAPQLTSRVDWSLLPRGVAVTLGGRNYSVASWRNEHRGFSDNCIAGTPKYSTTPDKATPSTYRLHPSSPGYRAGSDGLDMGAGDVDLIGPSWLQV